MSPQGVFVELSCVYHVCQSGVKGKSRRDCLTVNSQIVPLNYLESILFASLKSQGAAEGTLLL